MPMTNQPNVKYLQGKSVNDRDPYVLGIDGCRGGWFAILLLENAYGFTTYQNWKSLLDQHLVSIWPAEVIAVDMPIGLIDHGRRPCDQLARKRLSAASGGSGRTSSIFSPPRRPMLSMIDYDKANAWGKAQGPLKTHGGGLSKQAWNLKAKIREIDDLIHPDQQDIIIEAHPELAFLRRNNNTALASKHTNAGRIKRIEILNAYGLPIESILQQARSMQGVQPDDVIDAGVLALVAWNKYMAGNNAVQSNDSSLTATQQHHAEEKLDARLTSDLPYQNLSSFKWIAKTNAKPPALQDDTVDCLYGTPHRDSRRLRMEIWY